MRLGSKLTKLLGGIAAGLIALSYGFWSHNQNRKAQEQEFLSLIDQLTVYIRAEENFPGPPPILLLPPKTPLSQTLINGASAYNKKNYPEAIKSFESLELSRPDLPALCSLTAAAHLRERNYSLAAQKYRKALIRKPDGRTEELSAARDAAGLSLTLFQLSDFSFSYQNALKAYDLRKKYLGPVSRETVSAANILASALMAIKDNSQAGRLLKESILGALNHGLKKDDPIIVDGLHLLALAYSLDGRLDELTDLGELAALASPAPDLPAAAEPQNVPAKAPAAGNLSQGAAAVLKDQAPAPLPLDYAIGFSLWEELKTHSPMSPILGDLTEALISQRNGQKTPGEKPTPMAPPDINDPVRYITLCLELAQNFAQDEKPAEALEILQKLTVWVPDTALIREIKIRQAQLLGILGRWAECEAVLRDNLASQSDKVGRPDPLDISLAVNQTIFLAEAILKQGRIIEEAELELVAVQTKLAKKVPRRELETYPAVARLYLRLSVLLKNRGRQKDSQNYLRLAQRVLRNAEKAFPEKDAEIAYLKSQIPQGRTGKSQPQKPETPSGPEPLSKTEPTPEALRLELSAYKFLARLPEFEERIIPVISNLTAQTDLTTYRRYLSLWLKYLEERNDITALVAELDRLIENPLGQTDTEQGRFTIAALNYKARLLAKEGQKTEAAEVYGLMLDTPELKSLLNDSQIMDLQNAISSLKN
ncbi:MAG: hypothetical protein LBP22_10640 [Deltaproteobacteria bacterium]|jgi:hypothetical protein|nr:hypothetical protein [Deltaproteobacteria bacterium]